MLPQYSVLHQHKNVDPPTESFVFSKKKKEIVSKIRVPTETHRGSLENIILPIFILINF
jgi:hypothetical protein